MGFWEQQLSGVSDPALDAAWQDPPARKGFFTDTSICIGCKACEVACKEWNRVPSVTAPIMTGDSYDNTGHLGADTWRHVAFVEQGQGRVEAARESGRALVDLGMPALRAPEQLLPTATSMRVPDASPTGLPLTGPGTALSVGDVTLGPGEVDLDAAQVAAQQAAAAGTLPNFRWLIASDVCKHCTHAGCLDVCPTGALFRTEFGTVVVQDDVCNGCGYCVAACPFGVIERRGGHEEHPTPTQERSLSAGHGRAERTAVINEGVAQKCTLCYDRLKADQTPACAQACPTTSIQFGDLSEMRERAQQRVDTLREKGFTEARVYGANPDDGVGGTGSVFLLLDEPEVYGLPPDPIVTTAVLPAIFRHAGIAAGAMIALGVAAFASGRS